MEKQPPPEKDRFKANAEDLGKTMHYHVLRLHKAGHKIVSPVVVEISVAFVKMIDSKDLIEGFIKRSSKIWPVIKGKTKGFFTSPDAAQTIFGELPEKNVNLFFDLFKEQSNSQSLIGTEGENEIWTFLHAMVRISIKYIYLKRKNHTYEPEIDLDQHVKMWEVKLPT